MTATGTAARPQGPVLSAVRRYPFATATALVAVVAVTLVLGGQDIAARWLVSAYATAAAAREAHAMIAALRRGRIGLDVLALLAISATLLVGEHWASLVIVAMLAGGEALEDYATHRASATIRALVASIPQVAHRMQGGALIDVPVETVREGDLLLVRPGETLPVDGVLRGGPAVLDESQLTGESLPVEHAPGARVMSGTVNTGSPLVLQATAVAADSQYQQVVDLVRAASESRAPMVRLADRYAVPFTIVAVLIAALAWWVSGDPRRAAEVLVVATPCPLLLAAPIAFVAGISRAARAGIIVRGGGTLEQLAKARTVAFDKTGTITEGAPRVVSAEPRAPFTQEELLAVAASAEQYSSHVLAAAVVDAARGRGIHVPPATDVVESTANGVAATVEGDAVLVGKLAYLESSGIPVERSTPVRGRMSVHVAVAGAYAGRLELADAVRPEAAGTVASLRGMGIPELLMVTGDEVGTADAVARAVGIRRVHASCLPQDKVRVVEAQQDRPVVMVGDGVNDAPVLAAADVGIAMGARGATAASESADAVILLDDLGRLVAAFTIGRQTTSIAVRAILVGILLSVGLMLVASVGVVPALLGAGLQELVDLATILYALRAVHGGDRAASRRVLERDHRP